MNQDQKRVIEAHENVKELLIQQPETWEQVQKHFKNISDGLVQFQTNILSKALKSQKFMFKYKKYISVAQFFSEISNSAHLPSRLTACFSVWIWLNISKIPILPKLKNYIEKNINIQNLTFQQVLFPFQLCLTTMQIKQIKNQQFEQNITKIFNYVMIPSNCQYQNLDIAYYFHTCQQSKLSSKIQKYLQMFNYKLHQVNPQIILHNIDIMNIIYQGYMPSDLFLHSLWKFILRNQKDNLQEARILKVLSTEFHLPEQFYELYIKNMK